MFSSDGQELLDKCQTPVLSVLNAYEFTILKLASGK